MNKIQEYFSLSRTGSHNFVLSMLLLGLYELFKMLFGSSMKIINAVDAWFQYILNMFPYKTWIVSAIIFLVGLFFFVQDRKKGIKLSFSVLFIMLIEAIIWASLIFYFLPMFVGYLSNFIPMQVKAHTSNLFQEIVLSLGAGFYEELFFRLILVYFLYLVFKIIKRPESKIMQNILIVIITALLFSWVHYIGELGDEFTLKSFIYRTLFGMIMSILIVTRGFAITSWSHAIYDIFVFTSRAMLY